MSTFGLPSLPPLQLEHQKGTFTTFQSFGNHYPLTPPPKTFLDTSPAPSTKTASTFPRNGQETRFPL